MESACRNIAPYGILYCDPIRNIKGFEAPRRPPGPFAIDIDVTTGPPHWAPRYLSVRKYSTPAFAICGYAIPFGRSEVRKFYSVSRPTTYVSRGAIAFAASDITATSRKSATQIGFGYIGNNSSTNSAIRNGDGEITTPLTGRARSGMVKGMGVPIDSLRLTKVPLHRSFQASAPVGREWCISGGPRTLEAVSPAIDNLIKTQLFASRIEWVAFSETPSKNSLWKSLPHFVLAAPR